jgi:hypothetical protein
VKLLDYVVSECRWKGGELEAVYREPFEVLATAQRAVKLPELKQADHTPRA